ncbi:MobF family relaxase [Nocardiopsis sp. NPDC006139]|uniref:MobF family relaxase n=1 Tax=Nocardiopsis sp. NPDC006139 TaxID=3154578 RepID=UPI0033AA9E55
MVTPIRTAAQADYRLSQECGADEIRAADVAVDYRLETDGRDPIIRLGAGWAEFGHEAGTALEGPADIEGVRRIMAGRDPRTGERLVAFKQAVAPAAQLPARPLVDAVRAAAAEGFTSPAALLKASGWSTKRFARLERGLLRDGEHHRAPVGDLGRVAAAAGIDLEAVYEPGELAHALAHADDRVDIGIRATDVVFDRPRKVELAQAAAREAAPALARRMEEIHDQAVAETMRHVERWIAYSLTGHHGDGRSAERVDTTGIIATATKHRTARPVGDGPGDPHTHTHVMISVMGRSVEDGRWRTIGSGGRELMRHVATMGELQRALERRMLTEEFGFAFARDEVTGRWDLVGIPDEVKHAFSRRQAQVLAEAGDGADTAAQRAAARRTAQAKVHSTRAEEAQAWAGRMRELGFAPPVLVRAALEGREPGAGAAARPRRGPGPGEPPDIGALAARVWDPEHGVTSKDKTVTRAKVMAAVAEACEHGLASGEELAVLTDAVLEHGRAVRLPASGASHMTHADRYTSPDLVAAETVIETSARRRMHDYSASVHFKTIRRAQSAWERKKGFRLSPEQGKVVFRLTFLPHGIDTVVGVAGAGKTTIMSAARTIWEAGGLRVEGAANAAVAAAGLRAEAGIDSGTVASLLRRIADGPGLDGVDVLVLDEAATIDDRALAAIVTEANRTKTKLVAIGDPLQARAVGAGGGFARIHEIVGGEVLTENRRQRHAVDRRALQTWREGGRRSALALWGEKGMVHAPVDVDAAHAQITAAWARDRKTFPYPTGSPEEGHAAVERLVVMAATNADVDALNARIRAAARTEGYLSGEDVSYRMRGGRTLELAAGDQIRVRQNDYRSRREAGAPDVLNGFRGVVREVDARRGALIEWRTQGRTEQAWIDPERISRGALTHGYAITIASAQGLTTQRAHVHGLGADAHSLYPAMSRATERVDLYLPAAQIEPEAVRARLGEARTAEEGLHRVISAYANTLTDGPEGMVLDELAGGRERREEQERALEERAAQEAARKQQEKERERAGAPTPWEPLTERAARQGQGPAARSAAPLIQERIERAGALEQELEGLREQYRQAATRAGRGRLSLLLEGTTKGAATAERKALGERINAASDEASRLRLEARALRQDALVADLGRARADAGRADLERRDRQHQQKLEKAQKIGFSQGYTRAELERLPEHHLQQVITRHALEATRLPGRDRDHRHETKIAAPEVPDYGRDPALDLDLTRRSEVEDYTRRMQWELDQEDAERRQRERLEADLRRQQIEEQRAYAEQTARYEAYRAPERGGPELSM